MSAAIDDPILKRFRADLDALYGDRIERVVLFGSRPRGDARAASDYDVAVFLNDLTDRWHAIQSQIDLVDSVLGSYFKYYRPGFHPWQVDDRALVAQYELSLA